VKGDAMDMWKLLPEIAKIKGMSLQEILRGAIELKLPIYELGRMGKPLKNAIPVTWRRNLFVQVNSSESHLRLNPNEFAMYESDIESAWPSLQPKKSKRSYTTTTLSILDATIAEFFDPRRETDAKRDEVVAWIKIQMTRKGMTDSDNIAKAIFTIIKPEDHNPKKKRVEPQ
jgi:hypothetical protein